MTAGGVVFHRLAAAEFRKAQAWYAERSQPAAKRFRQAVAETVAKLAADAERYPTIVRDYRVARVSRFPFVLIYFRRPRGDLMIVAVAHTSRRPTYWRRRQ